MVYSDFLLKLIVTGDCNVGKTSFCTALSDDTFEVEPIPTIGVEFTSVVVPAGKGQTARCQLWDLSGNPAFRSIVDSYYRGVVGALVLFDLSDRSTFDGLQVWVDQVKANRQGPGPVRVFLVGNKSDKKHAVREDEALWFAHSNGMGYITVSVTHGNPRDVMTALAREILNDKGKLRGHPGFKRMTVDTHIPSKGLLLRKSDLQAPGPYDRIRENLCTVL